MGINTVTLVEIREEDGAQKYQYEDGDFEWLLDVARAEDVKVGDKGILRYSRYKTAAFLTFIKKENEDGISSDV